MIPFGLSPFGFRAKRLNDIKTDLDNQMTAEFGDVNLSPQSVMGQLIGVTSKVLADLWENLEQVYFSQYPNSADGVALDNVVQFNGIIRLPASPTQVTGIATGIEGTLIPAGSLARVINSNEVFVSTQDSIITSSNASLATVQVTALAGQIYTVLINAEPFRFSLPRVTFSTPFTAGDVATVTINNIVLGTVPFVSTSNVMLAAIAALIQTSPAVASASAINPDKIDIIPNLGFYAAVTSINTTGGAAPTITTTYKVPVNEAYVISYLIGVINAGTEPVTASSAFADDFVIESDLASVPFSLNLGTSLSATSRSSPVKFEAQNDGPIAVPANTLTQIITPLAGWESLTNPQDGVIGRFIETDAELRLRRLNSLRLLGRGTVEAIRAQLLAVGATSALVFENRTMLQNPSAFTLSADLIGGDSVTLTLNGIAQTPIAFSVSHLNTMNLIANQIENFPGVNSAVVGGTGNRSIAITFIQGFEVLITGILITPSSTGVIISNGRPPKSFEAVVQGQTDEIIANTIWLSKPAGIQTFGSTMFPITDSQGDSQAIFFSRPTEVYIWVNVVLTLYSEETFPSDGLDLVQAAIFNYINDLGIGVDVLIQRVNAQIFDVPGIASGVMTLAATGSPAESPTPGSVDIPIGENQIAITQLDLIVVTL